MQLGDQSWREYARANRIEFPSSGDLLFGTAI